MSNPSASSHVASSTARAMPLSLRTTIRRIARLMWRSYERHSLYQVMLAAGHDEDAPDDLALRARRGGQH
ncbi:hypothetical protein [Paraburkholderia sp.]|jgi:hypothetical protein|uniref:hypothetical protein n=1 Tax=Paraburkholderia sp. TaxID=1926495 RepID=UPI002F42CBEE